jgi:hypothetical protein
MSLFAARLGTTLRAQLIPVTEVLRTRFARGDFLLAMTILKGKSQQSAK